MVKVIKISGAPFHHPKIPVSKGTLSSQEGFRLGHFDPCE